MQIALCKLLFLQKTTAPPPQTKQSFARPSGRRRSFGAPSAGQDRRSEQPVRTQNGGAERDRTADPLLAKQVLSQLSYSPNLLGTASTDLISTKPVHQHHLPQNPSSRSNPSPRPTSTNKRMVGLGRLELPTPRLSSVCSNQLSYRPDLDKLYVK